VRVLARYAVWVALACVVYLFYQVLSHPLPSFTEPDWFSQLPQLIPWTLAFAAALVCAVIAVLSRRPSASIAGTAAGFILVAGVTTARPSAAVRETIAVAAISNLGQGGRIFAGLRANKSVWDIVDRVADLFGFTSKLEQPAKSLSQGDKKLLDVASAFALRPEIILLDEPTSGVSTAEKAKIMQVLVEAAKHTGIKAIIQVEHDMDIVFGYSTRIIAVHNGRILADGTPEAIRAQSDVMATVVGRL